MSFTSNVFKKKEEQIKSNEDFWKWFQQNERDFYKVVKDHNDIEKDFFDKLSPKLDQLRDGFFFLTGMLDDETAELIITAEGVLQNYVFVEELINSAPKIPGWKFTAHKPASNEGFSINMAGYEFDNKNINFYSNDDPNYPDEIDITVVYDNYNEEDKATVTNGVYIYLDNLLGELESLTTIDSITITGRESNQKLIPIEKLKHYLIWRQKEFVEKYDGIRYDTDDDLCSVFEAKLNSGNKLIATINTDLLRWDRKASHPWIFTVTIKFEGEDNNGMPDEETYQLLDEFEDKLLAELKDYEGYLYVGRQTADSEREIYFACKDFRKPSKVTSQIKDSYSSRIEIDFDVYIDKYWKSFNRFRNE